MDEASLFADPCMKLRCDNVLVTLLAVASAVAIVVGFAMARLEFSFVFFGRKGFAFECRALCGIRLGFSLTEFVQALYPVLPKSRRQGVVGGVNPRSVVTLRPEPVITV